MRVPQIRRGASTPGTRPAGGGDAGAGASRTGRSSVRRSAAVAGVVLLGSAVLAACGDDGTSPASVTEPVTSTSTPAPAPAKSSASTPDGDLMSGTDHMNGMPAGDPAAADSH